MKFAELRLAEPLLRAVSAAGYVTATPIQAQAIPFALEGRDVLGSAQTGTGKTAAFALPILQRLSSAPRTENKTRARALILAPTRELATQISDDFRAYGKFLHLRQTVIFGGVGQNPQVNDLRRGVDIVIATPGRLLDLMEQGHVDLRGIEVLVLDEADRMLDMGFIHDIRKVVARVPQQKQTLLFSATMPREIRGLADSLMKNPASVQVAPTTSTADKIDQSVYHVSRGDKPMLLAHLVNTLPMTRAIVFTRTKHGADRVVRHLHTRGIRAEAIHGNKSQNSRQRALDNFKANKIPVLVATDIASRGIDVDGITHVVNYDVTHEPETYIHRIGRTARAGASGQAVSLCDPEERSNLRAIEKLIRQTITVKTDHPTYAKSDRPQQNERHEGRGERHTQRRDDRGGDSRGDRRDGRVEHPRTLGRKPTHNSAGGGGRPRHPQPASHASARATNARPNATPQKTASHSNTPANHAPRPRHPLAAVGGGVRKSGFAKSFSRSR